jgi:hypothetical protein
MVEEGESNHSGVPQVHHDTSGIIIGRGYNMKEKKPQK